MKKVCFFLLASIFILSTNFAQVIPISYTLAINKAGDLNDPTSDPESAYYKETFLNENGERVDFTFHKTKFNSDELNQLYSRFVNHIIINKSVKNYIWTGLTSPSFVPLIKASIHEFLDSKTYMKLGNLYVNLANSIIRWKDTVAVSSDSTLMLNKQGVYSSKDAIQIIDDLGNIQDYWVQSVGSPNDISSIGFTETWNFDIKKGVFSKNVVTTSLLNVIFDKNTGDYRGQKICLNFMNSPQNNSKNLLKANIEYDVLFDKWNTCMYYNQTPKFNCIEAATALNTGVPFNGPFISGELRGNLFLNIFSAIQSNQLIAVDAEQWDLNKYEKILTPDEMYKSMITTFTAQIVSDIPPYDIKDTTLEAGLEASNILGIRFIEDWYLYPAQFNFYKKIKYFALLYNKIDINTGELIGYYPLFYIRSKK